MKFLPKLFAISYLSLSSVTGMEDENIEKNTSVNSSKTLPTLGDYFKTFDEQSSYLKLEPFTFEYNPARKSTTFINSFYVGNTFSLKSKWGEVALYPQDVNLGKIKYFYGKFSDLGQGTALFLSTLSYEYIQENESHPDYLIIEFVKTSIDVKGATLQGKGYSQACLKYFIDEFVKKHTSIKYVFSDLRNIACTKFFPKYGFQAGLPEELKNIQFTRSMRSPYFWQKHNS